MNNSCLRSWGAGLAILTVMVLQSARAQTKPSNASVNSDKPPALSREFQAVGQLAYEAIERLDDYIDKPAASYEPRQLDAEKALSDAKRKAKSAEDKHVSKVLDNWLLALDGQRQFMPSPSDGRISNASTIARAYGEQSKQAIVANRRALEAQTNADKTAAANLAAPCDSYPTNTQRIDCTRAVIAKLKAFQNDLAAGKSPAPIAPPLGQTPTLKYWEQTIFPCAVEAGWFFGETLTKEGIETAKRSDCVDASKP
jgi:hypothetical protein